MRVAEAIEAATPRRSLRSRDLRAEQMDDPALDPTVHERALRGLARLNRASAADRPLWSAIAPHAASLDRPLRLLDVATGGGDVLVALERRAARAGVAVEAVGCDISPVALGVARRRAAAAGARASFVRLDALRDPLPGGFDVAMCSLFLHHLDDADTRLLLARMGGVARIVVASDLVRSRVGLALAWAAGRRLSRSPVVHADAPASVRAAYTPEEMRRAARDAGLGRVRVQPVWPQRMILIAEGVA